MKTKGRPIRIIDNRKKQYFVVDDAYLNGFARHLGPIASMTYIALCRHVDKDQYAFPSQETIAEEIGASVRAVKNAIKKLKLWNIIDIKRERTAHRWEKNSYYLLDKSVWENPSSAGDAHDRSGANNDTDQGHLVHTKETHIKEDISNDISIAAQESSMSYKDIVSSSTKVIGGRANKENKTISYLIAYMEQKIGVPLDGSKQKNRQYCYHLLNKFSPQQIETMIDNVVADPFWKDKVKSFATLFNHANQLLLISKKKDLDILKQFKKYEKS